MILTHLRLLYPYKMGCYFICLLKKLFFNSYLLLIIDRCFIKLIDEFIFIFWLIMLKTFAFSFRIHIYVWLIIDGLWNE